MSTSKKELEQMMESMVDELKGNMELFKKLPHDRLAYLASGMFSTCSRLAALSPTGVAIIATTGILYEANSFVKAYNNDKQLKMEL